jgi:hypothetical protein
VGHLADVVHEYQRDNVGGIEPVDESWELLGFVFDGFEPEPDRDGVEVELGSEISAGDDILNGDRRILADVNSEVAKHLADGLEGTMYIVDRRPPSADNFPRPEDEVRGFGLLRPIDKPWKRIWIVLRTAEIHRQTVECEFLSDVGRSDDVLDIDRFTDGRHSTYQLSHNRA